MALAFPNVWPSSVEVVKARAQVATVSPTSFGAQVQDRGGRQYRIVIRFDRVGRTKAALLCAFVAALDGMADTFLFDLDPWCPGESPAPGVREFRVVAGATGWTSRGAVEFSYQIAAYEEVSA
jgi:hypothetical protein